jgi:hypothetical protein
MLYFVNTLGAAAGALATSFLLISRAVFVAANQRGLGSMT